MYSKFIFFVVELYIYIYIYIYIYCKKKKTIFGDIRLINLFPSC